jgi:hypothetical protein
MEHGAVTRISFGISVGAWLAGLLWMTVQNAYVSVFIIGACLGVYMLENWSLMEQIREKDGEIWELQKQVVGLRSVTRELGLANEVLEREKRIIRARNLPRRMDSTGSL